MEPRMTPVECVAMETWLKTRGARRILEWGAGGSTVTFPQVVPDLDEWVAIEHNLEWFWALALAQTKESIGNVWLRYVPPEQWDPEQIDREDTFEQFTSYVLEVISHLPLDLAIVDGRARNACLALAARLGIPEVIVHDIELDDGRRYARGLFWWEEVERRERLGLYRPRFRTVSFKTV